MFCHLYNMTWLNERGVELAIWNTWKRNLSTLEVGNVLNHYEPLAFDHVVVDRYEVGDGVVNEDVLSFRGSFDQIVSISTVEHVRWDEPTEREADGAVRAVQHLVSLLAPGGRMLVTAPTGHNPGLDEWFLHGGEADRLSTFARDGGPFDPVWRQTDTLEPRGYGVSQPWAEGLWVGEWYR